MFSSKLCPLLRTWYMFVVCLYCELLGPFKGVTGVRFITQRIPSQQTLNPYYKEDFWQYMHFHSDGLVTQQFKLFYQKEMVLMVWPVMTATEYTYTFWWCIFRCSWTNNTARDEKPSEPERVYWITSEWSSPKSVTVSGRFILVRHVLVSRLFFQPC